MSDLIERLLKQETTGWAYNDSRKPVKELRNPDGPEAAARIAELEAENARLREALGEVIECDPGAYEARIARAALKEQER